MSSARLATAIIMNIACSATLVELAVPVTISGRPCSVSAGTSTASKPTPIRAATSSFGLGLHLGAAELREGQRDSARLGQQSVELGRRDRGRVDDHLDIVARLQQP